MKRLTPLFLFLAGMAPASSVLADYAYTPFPHYMPPSAIYVTVGGGVAGMLHSDFYRSPNPPPSLDVRQPSSSEPVVGTINAAIGYQFHTIPIRAEVAYQWYDEASYTWDILYVGYDDHDGYGTLKSETVLFNLYYDWYNRTRFTPFIGGGVGYYHTRSAFDHSFISTANSLPTGYNTNQGLAWTAILGVKYEITSSWLIDIRAQYTDLGSVFIYEDNGPNGSRPNRQPEMKTDTFSAVSGLLNITYAYHL